jgi:hypothetical protein
MSHVVVQAAGHEEGGARYDVQKIEFPAKIETTTHGLLITIGLW